MLVTLIMPPMVPASQQGGDLLAFYQVAATVIPVLFIGLAYQARALRSLRKEFAVMFSLVMTFVAIKGEFTAMRVLAAGSIAGGDQGVVYAVLGLMLLALMFEPLVSLMIDLTDDDVVLPGDRLLGIPRSDRSRLLRVSIIAFPAVVAYVLLGALGGRWLL